MSTVNVDIFTQYTFLCILQRVFSGKKFDVSEKFNHNRTNRVKYYVRKNLTTHKRLLGPDA